MVRIESDLRGLSFADEFATALDEERWQAEIAPGPNGLMLRDLESTNGVFLDGPRVNHDEALRPGIEIRIGSTTMTCEAGPG